LARCAVAPAVGLPRCGDAAGVARSGGDGGELELTGHQLGCGLVDRAAVSELPILPESPAVGVARGGDATGVIAPDIDVGELEVAAHQLGSEMGGRPAVSALAKQAVAP